MQLYQRRAPSATTTTDATGCVVVSVVPPPQLDSNNGAHFPESPRPLQQQHEEGDAAAAAAAAGGPASPLYAIAGAASAQIQNLVAREGTVWTVVYRRLSVLVSLLLLQSMSQFVLEAFENVVQANIVIPLFLTMLVGAGGNAGNQSAVRAIAMLAKGEINGSKWMHVLPVVRRECVIGFVCAVVLSMIGALRVFAHQVARRSSSSSSSVDAAESGVTSNQQQQQQVEAASIAATVFAISVSLFFIVFLSAVIGVTLPFVFIRFGASAEHAAPAIQVIMDVLGVFLTCVVCSLMLPSTPPR